MLANPDYVKAGAVLDGIELFDASFFGFTPKEAEMLDPQQRFFWSVPGRLSRMPVMTRKPIKVPSVSMPAR